MHAPLKRVHGNHTLRQMSAEYWEYDTEHYLAETKLVMFHYTEQTPNRFLELFL